MKVEITIIIDAKEERFDEAELRYDILNSFVERTGYDIEELDINPDKD